VTFKGGRAFAWLVIVNLVIAVVLLEVGLRAQQTIGPLYDLAPRPDAIMIGLSDELNHVHLPGGDWDGDGIRMMDEPNPARCAARLLFMGDSFMEGLGPNDAVPIHVRRFFKQSLGKDLCVFNAACSSYSPSIFVPQAKKLISLVAPDLIVIDIDETDLYDDYYRYRKLVTRDAAGSIVAVGRTPITAQFQQGLMESTDKALYLHRFLAKLYFTKIEYPRAFARYYQDKPTDMLWLSRFPAAETRERYGAAIDHFEATLDDLTQTVLARTGRPDRLIYLHHPHLEHVRTSGPMFNTIVFATVSQVASRHNVQYYDATEDLRKEFGAKPENYYIPDDMHFNAAGIRAYGIAVARRLATVLNGD
jgi:hypothetical protein